MNEELENILGQRENPIELPEVPGEDLPEIGKCYRLIYKNQSTKLFNSFSFHLNTEKPEKIKAAANEKRERLLVEAQ